jgi:hypothetical protein
MIAVRNYCATHGEPSLAPPKHGAGLFWRAARMEQMEQMEQILPKNPQNTRLK